MGDGLLPMCQLAPPPACSLICLFIYPIPAGTATQPTCQLLPDHCPHGCPLITLPNRSLAQCPFDHLLSIHLFTAHSPAGCSCTHDIGGWQWQEDSMVVGSNSLTPMAKAQGFQWVLTPGVSDLYLWPVGCTTGLGKPMVYWIHIPVSMVLWVVTG